MTYFDTEFAATKYLTDHGLFTMDPQRVSSVLRDLIASIAALPRAITAEGVDGAPPWFATEWSLWVLGESLNKLVKRRKGEPLSPIIGVVSDTVRDRRFGKGRQTFVRILGGVDAEAHKELLMDLLDDPEVSGHAIKALRVGKVSGASERVREALRVARVGWIRTEAKKYLAKYP
ncbi:MAG: hypothetical protein HY898_19110 [Deltaproteobacteria bacterium]|nr:hypothetical protein [Deltaproteobacteria bacterium]